MPICLITCQHYWLACYISWFNSTHSFVSSSISFMNKWSTCLCFKPPDCVPLSLHLGRNESRNKPSHRRFSLPCHRSICTAAFSIKLTSLLQMDLLQWKTAFWPPFPMVSWTGSFYWWSYFCRNDSTDGSYCSGWMSLAFLQPLPILCAGAMVSWGRKELWLLSDVPFNLWLFYT